uniref:(northern house mosquito) hypothetical protein n=1 Tax=Culex pipiens TaxID=7175 RepID=A0A8D8HNF6_CULPI
MSTPLNRPHHPAAHRCGDIYGVTSAEAANRSAHAPHGPLRYKKGNNFYGVYVTMTLTSPGSNPDSSGWCSARNPRAKFSHVVGGGGLRMPWEMSIKSPPSQRLCSRGRGLKQSAHFFFQHQVIAL